MTALWSLAMEADSKEKLRLTAMHLFCMFDEFHLRLPVRKCLYVQHVVDMLVYIH